MKKKKEKEKVESMEWREAVKFLFRFIEKKPQELRAGDRLNLIEDCRRYLEIEGDGQPARELAEAEAKPAKLEGAIDAISKLIEQVADHDPSIILRIGPITHRLDASRLGEKHAPLFSEGALKDVMLDTALYDLVQAELWQICRCPECSTLFLAARKGQIYCSHRCANAVAVRMKRTKDRASKAKATKEA